MEEKEEVEINGNVVMRKVYSKDKKEGNGVVWKKNGEPRKVTKEKQGGRIKETVSSGGGGDQQKEVLSMADVEKIGMMRGVLLWQLQDCKRRLFLVVVHSWKLNYSLSNVTRMVCPR